MCAGAMGDSQDIRSMGGLYVDMSFISSCLMVYTFRRSTGTETVNINTSIRDYFGHKHKYSK